jgi:PKD repeat protein
MAPFTVTFTNTSSGWVTNSFWDFGDGATSNTMAASVAHTYDAGGNISVELIVSGPGGVSTNTRVGYLAVAPPCNYPLSGTNASFGATGGSDIVAVTPYTNVCAWTASSNDAWIQIADGGVSTTGSALVAYTVLSNAASSSSRVGTMTIAGQTFTVTQAGDTTSPTVALTSPTTGIVSNTVAVSATATDDVAVVQVEFYRDDGVLLGTDSTLPYTVNFNTATVSDGSHCFHAEARDAAGNVSSSPTNCVTVDNDAPSVPTGLAASAVATNQIYLSWHAANDGGSGVAGYRVFRDGTQIATTAGTNHTDSGLAIGTEHCYRVAAYDSVGRVSAQSAEACAQSFVRPGSLLGTYNGLAIQTNGPSHASSGSLTLVITKTGSFAAKLAMGGGKASFKGQFDAGGNATNTVVRKGLSSLQVVLHLDLTYGTDQITGTISDGVFTSEVLADRAVYGRTNPCPLAGVYTLVLVPPEGSDPDFPQGYGHGTLTVAATGGGKLSGVLGDGTKIKGNLPVSKHGTWPLYNVLYKKQGACLGWVTFGTNATLEATVDWFRPSLPGSAWYPAGFTTNVTLVGEKYVSASAAESGAAGNRQITLDGGNLASSIVETVTVDAVGHVMVLPPNNESLTMTLQLKTGQFSGSFTHPALNETIDFKGAVLQNSNAGAGHFFGTNESGSVILEPTP